MAALTLAGRWDFAIASLARQGLGLKIAARGGSG